jgi:hypothetical protein
VRTDKALIEFRRRAYTRKESIEKGHNFQEQALQGVLGEALQRCHVRFLEITLGFQLFTGYRQVEILPVVNPVLVPSLEDIIFLNGQAKLVLQQQRKFFHPESLLHGQDLLQ